MKSTLFCMHVMPHEIEMLERFMVQYRKALSYLDENDNFTMKVSLNLNPNLIIQLIHQFIYPMNYKFIIINYQINNL